jgi:hypothetical protein
MQPFWKGDTKAEETPDEKATYIKKCDHNIDWLSQVEEESEVLEKTDLGSCRWIGIPPPPKHSLDEEDKCRMVIPSQNCEPSKPQCLIENPPSTKTAPWYHPSFTFKIPVHAVRVELTQLTPEKKQLWDVVFAGKPGGPYRVTNDAVPAGGLQPQFHPFCQPLRADSKFELHMTEAKEGLFDETLTFKPMDPRLKLVTRNREPAPPLVLREHDVDDDLDDAEIGPVVESKSRASDKLTDADDHRDPFTGEVNYMSVPPLLAIGSLFL